MQAESGFEVWEHQPISLLPFYFFQAFWCFCIVIFWGYGESNWAIGLLLVCLMITSQVQAMRLSNWNSEYQALSTRVSHASISRNFRYAVSSLQDVEVSFEDIESISASNLSPSGASFLVKTRTEVVPF